MLLIFMSGKHECLYSFMCLSVQFCEHLSSQRQMSVLKSLALRLQELLLSVAFKVGKEYVHRNSENEVVLKRRGQGNKIHVSYNLFKIVTLFTKEPSLSPLPSSSPFSFSFPFPAIWFQSPSGLTGILYYTKMGCFNGQITSRLHTRNFIASVHSTTRLEKGNVV